MSGVEGGKGICYQWKEKGQCSKGDQCSSFWHKSNDRVQKPELTAATLCEPSMTRGRSVSRKRSIRGKSDHESIIRQPCRCYLKGTCTRTSCEYWHPAECQFYKTETGCKAGDNCLFPHCKVDEQPNKSREREQHPKKKRERRQEYHKIQMHSFLKVESLGETRCRKSWNQLKGYDSLCLRYVMRVSGKRKDHRWEK